MSSPDWYSTWKQWDERAFAQPAAHEHAYYDAELGPLLDAQASRIIELGFGNGALLGWCRARGHACVGVETNPALIDKAERAGFDVAGSLAQARERYGAAGYDLSVAFDVLEHVPDADIPALLRELRSALRENGLLVLRFPNGDSPFGRAYQHGDVTHTTVIASEKLRYFARRTGFRVERLKSPAVPLRGMGIVKRCKHLTALAACRVMDTVIAYAYFAGEVRVFSPNMIAVLRRVDTPGGAS